MIARFARIYPLHFLTFFVSIPLVIYGIKDFSLLLIFKSITNLTLTQSFVPLKSIYFSFNAPSWSISNEMFFYILFPFILTFVGFFRKKWFLLLLVFASIPLLSIIISNDFHHRLFYINPVFRIVDFVIGISLYNLYRLIKNMNLNFNYNYIEISSVILFSVFFFFHSDFPKVSRYSFFYWIPMSYIILVFSFQKGIISKFLSQKWLIYLGEISFGFYMFHQLVIRYFLPLNNRYLGIENEIHQSLMIFILSLLISHYSFKYFENPINSYLKNKLHRKNYTQHRL